MSDDNAAPPPPPGPPPPGAPKLKADAPAFSFNANAPTFAFKPRNLPSGAGGASPAPPPGPPPGGPPVFFERPAAPTGPPAKAKSLAIGGEAPKKAATVTIGGDGAPQFFERPAPPEGAPAKAKALSIGGEAAPAKAKSLSIGGPAKVVSIGGPPPAAKEEPAPAPEKVAEKVAEMKVAEEKPKPAPAPVEKEEDVPIADDGAEDANFDPREHLNLVFIGHVDAGQEHHRRPDPLPSRHGGRPHDREVRARRKEKNRESWYMAYIMDTNEEERAKGKTVEVGRAHFETEKKRYTVLDAPGHKNYVPNMIAGAAQADVGVLVIAARKGEFETGFERGGQTREHAQLAKTLGVTKLIVLVNKMDDPTVKWDKARWDEINAKLSPFLKSCGYTFQGRAVRARVGLYGTNMKTTVGKRRVPVVRGQVILRDARRPRAARPQPRRAVPHARPGQAQGHGHDRDGQDGGGHRAAGRQARRHAQRRQRAGGGARVPRRRRGAQGMRRARTSACA